MTIVPRPYKKSPYKDMERLGCPWLSNLRKAIDEKISSIMENLKKEAECDGEPLLTSEDFLYAHYKDNREHGMYRANWQVLKYFSWLFMIKIYRDMVDDWSFTDHDKEMYEYFANTNFNSDNRCKPKYLKLNSVETEDNDGVFKHIDIDFSHSIWFLDRKYTDRYSGDMHCKYCDVFHNMAEKLNGMLLHAEGKPNHLLSCEFVDFFSTNKLHGLDYYHKPVYDDLYMVSLEEIDINKIRRDYLSSAHDNCKEINVLVNNKDFIFKLDHLYEKATGYYNEICYLYDELLNIANNLLKEQGTANRNKVRSFMKTITKELPDLRKCSERL